MTNCRKKLCNLEQIASLTEFELQQPRPDRVKDVQNLLQGISECPSKSSHSQAVSLHFHFSSRAYSDLLKISISFLNWHFAKHRKFDRFAAILDVSRSKTPSRNSNLHFYSIKYAGKPVILTMFIYNSMITLFKNFWEKIWSSNNVTHSQVWKFSEKQV